MAHFVCCPAVVDDGLVVNRPVGIGTTFTAHMTDVHRENQEKKHNFVLALGVHTRFI